MNTPVAMVNKDIIEIMNNMTGNKIKDFKMIIEWEMKEEDEK